MRGKKVAEVLYSTTKHFLTEVQTRSYITMDAASSPSPIRCTQAECVKAGNMRQGFILLLYVLLLKNSFAQADSIPTSIIII